MAAVVSAAGVTLKFRTSIEVNSRRSTIAKLYILRSVQWRATPCQHILLTGAVAAANRERDEGSLAMGV